MNNAEWLQFLQDLEDLETGLKYVDLSSFEKTLRTARELLVEYRKQSKIRPQDEFALKELRRWFIAQGYSEGTVDDKIEDFGRFVKQVREDEG